MSEKSNFDVDKDGVYNRSLDIHATPREVPIIRELLQIPVDNYAPLRRKAMGFLVKSMAIHNITGSWWYSPSLIAYIPPWAVNLVINIPGGTQLLDFYPDTPAGEVSNPVTGQNLLAIACSVEQGPTSISLYTHTEPTP